jgi:two-component system sensor histidine kinase BarA
MQFDLILMDIQMPGMDGIRACELIHQLPHQQQTPVIAVTAHAMAGQKEKLLSAGMNDYLAKPIDEEKLHNLLLRYKPGHIGGTYTVSAEPLRTPSTRTPRSTGSWRCARRRETRFGARNAANAGRVSAGNSQQDGRTTGG